MNTVSENHSTHEFQWLGLAGIFLFLTGCASIKCYEGDRSEGGYCFDKNGTRYQISSKCREGDSYLQGFCFDKSGSAYQLSGTRTDCADGYLYNSEFHLCFNVSKTFSSDATFKISLSHAYDPDSSRYCADGYLYRQYLCYDRNHLDSIYHSYNPDGVCADNYRYKDGLCHAGCALGYEYTDGICRAYCEYLHYPENGVCIRLGNETSYYVPSAYALPSFYAPGPATIHQQATQQIIVPQQRVIITPQPVVQPIIQQTIIQETAVVTPPPVQPIRPPSQPAKPPAPAAKPPAESSRETPKPSKPEREESRPNDTRKPTTEPARGVEPSQAIRKR